MGKTLDIRKIVEVSGVAFRPRGKEISRRYERKIANVVGNADLKGDVGALGEASSREKEKKVVDGVMVLSSRGDGKEEKRRKRRGGEGDGKVRRWNLEETFWSGNRGWTALAPSGGDVRGLWGFRGTGPIRARHLLGRGLLLRQRYA
jgi:hypothetical protein